MVVGWAYLPNAYIFCTSGHYLQTLTALKILCISVTPFSLARLSSLRKEGKSAVLDFDASEKRGFPSLGHWVHFAHTACPSKSASWIIASRLQAVRFILFSQNIRSLFRRFFEFRASPSLYAKSAKKREFVMNSRRIFFDSSCV